MQNLQFAALSPTSGRIRWRRGGDYRGDMIRRQEEENEIFCDRSFLLDEVRAGVHRFSRERSRSVSVLHCFVPVPRRNSALEAEEFRPRTVRTCRDARSQLSTSRYTVSLVSRNQHLGLAGLSCHMSGHLSLNTREVYCHHLREEHDRNQNRISETAALHPVPSRRLPRLPWLENGGKLASRQGQEIPSCPP